MKQTIKRIAMFLTAIVAVGAIFTSCAPTEEEYFDVNLLYGKWQSGTEFWRYDSNGNGATWDTADDVTEEEAQTFTWTLEANELTQIHIMEIGGSVPKVYTVTELNFTTLRYHDNFKSYSFTRVK